LPAGAASTTRASRSARSTSTPTDGGGEPMETSLLVGPMVLFVLMAIVRASTPPTASPS
jgi:hypothetical protein